MNDPNTPYSFPTDESNRYAKEPGISYVSRMAQSPRVIHTTSEDVFKDSMTLDESQRLIEERINRHFHRV